MLLIIALGITLFYLGKYNYNSNIEGPTALAKEKDDVAALKAKAALQVTVEKFSP